MNQEKAIVGFIGAGGITRFHAFSINSLRYFYNDSPEIELEAVCSATKESRLSFIPDIEHGLAVQRLVRQTAEKLEDFRTLTA